MTKVGNSLEKVDLNLIDPYVIVLQVLNRLETLHKLGFTHGDIKPENICLDFTNNTQQPQVHLVDFGLSTSYLDSNGAHI